MRTRILVLLLAGAAALGLSVAMAGPSGEPRFHGTAYEPPEPAPDFRLTDHHNREVALSDFRGSAVLLFFGFTRCPDVCPLTLNRLSRVVGDLGEDAGNVRVLLVTVDPANDTPEALAEYVARFAAPVTGLTGDSATLAAVRDAYHVHAGPGPSDSGHAMTHTSAVFGIDREGRLRVLLPLHEQDPVVVEDLRALLR